VKTPKHQHHHKNSNYYGHRHDSFTQVQVWSLMLIVQRFIPSVFLSFFQSVCVCVPQCGILSGKHKLLSGLKCPTTIMHRHRTPHCMYTSLTRC